MFKILVVEDDKNLRKLITTYLRKNEYITYEATNGEEALEVIETNYIDLIIREKKKKKMDGYELTKSLREANYTIPILLVTAKSTIGDKREGFLLGADDYMVKPVELDELLLRVRALLRRANVKMERKIKVGNLLMDADAMTTVVAGEELPVTTREFNILYKLLSYPNKTFSRAQLMDEFWGIGTDTSLRAVDVYITKLRDKYSACDGFKIVTVRGLGYKAVL